MDFNQKLARLRRERGLTQVELAARAGIHPSQLHRYEAGTAEPTLSVIRRLSMSLAVSSDELLFKDSYKDLVINRLRSAFELCYHLSEHEQAVISEIIENFALARQARNYPERGRTRRKLTRPDSS